MLDAHIAVAQAHIVVAHIAVARHAATYFCLGGQSIEKGHFTIEKGHFTNFPQGAFRPSAFTHPFDN